MSNKVSVSLTGRDYLEASLTEDNKIAGVQIKGCLDLLRMAETLKQSHGGDPRLWPLPVGQDHSSLLLREFILKLKSQWNFPYEHDELCHCRSIQAKVVDEAIVAGADTVERVSRETLAGTGCGTCRPEIQKIMAFRRFR